MPREDRRIIFDMSETYQALYRLSLKKDDEKTLKPGAVVKIEINSKNENQCNFHLHNPQEGTKEIVTYSNDFVAAALMMFCRGEGIPLPRKAQKAVMVREGQMVLRVVV